jgi:hypothetical protein
LSLILGRKLIKPNGPPSSVLASLGVLDNDDDGVAAQEHLRNVALFVLCFCTLSFRSISRSRAFRHFGPHLTRLFEHHVHVAVESLNTRQNLAVIPAIYQYLAV